MTHPTPAFPESILSKMRAQEQAVRWTMELGLVVQFRAFCCDIDSDGIMGVAKQPVVVLDISPNPVCLGDAVDWDLRDSYAPGSAITGYSIDMGDFTSYNVNNGNHTYAAVGVYTVKASVVEGGGRRQTVEAEVEVIDCAVPLLMRYAYTSFDGGGVYYIDFEAAAPVWVARNDGLEGNDLFVRALIQHPGTKHLRSTVHELWAATLGGLFRSGTGGRSWGRKTVNVPQNDADDVPAPTVDDLEFVDVEYSPIDGNTVYALATTATRSWVYFTFDAGITWNNEQVRE